MINFAARVVSGRRKFEHISDVVDELGWLSAKQQVAYSTLMLTHGILTTDEPESVRARFRFNRDTVMRNTRQSDHLRLTKARTNWGKNTFVNRASELYNKYALDCAHLSAARFRTEMRRRCAML